MAKKIPYSTEKEWLELRAEDITSTEVSALLGLSPYQTAYELYHQKLNKDLGEIPDNERMKWGRRLEAVVAKGIAKDLDIEIRALNTYMRHDTVERMGASFDYEVINHPMGPGIMEVKVVDRLVFMDKWTEEVAPTHIEIQLQHQLEVMDREWGLIVALVGGNEPIIIRRKRDRALGKNLIKAVQKHWARIEAKKPPAFKLPEDADFVIAMHKQAGGEILTTTEQKIVDWLIEYHDSSAMHKYHEVRKKELKALVLESVGDKYKKVLATNEKDGTLYQLACSTTADTPPHIIAQEDVGKKSGGRRGFRGFRLTVKPPKEREVEK